MDKFNDSAGFYSTNVKYQIFMKACLFLYVLGNSAVWDEAGFGLALSYSVSAHSLGLILFYCLYCMYNIVSTVPIWALPFVNNY